MENEEKQTNLDCSIAEILNHLDYSDKQCSIHHSISHHVFMFLFYLNLKESEISLSSGPLEINSHVTATQNPDVSRFSYFSIWMKHASGKSQNFRLVSIFCNDRERKGCISHCNSNDIVEHCMAVNFSFSAETIFFSIKKEFRKNLIFSTPLECLN